MPDGTNFAFWDDRTKCSRVYHVACGHPAASDENPGTEGRPLKTIGKAAALLAPGEKAVIHGGTYREFVQPLRGGTGPEAMIAYEAARGETVVVKGSRVWKPAARPSENWSIPAGDGKTIWMADLPAEWFGPYNPFLADNMFAHLCEFVSDWSRKDLERFQMRRGMIFLNGEPLTQVLHPRDLAGKDGVFWVEDPGLRIHFRLPSDADPRGCELEVTTQEQILAPRERYLGYIRVSGIVFEHAADGLPVPQRAMVSTFRGHHWIVEDCRIRRANAVGLDIGNEDWRASRQGPPGGHIVRRNHISHCGICGLAGVGSVDGSLVEDNVIEHVGTLVHERLWECAGCKLHIAKGVLIRRNVFRHIREASGLWLDYLNAGCRVTGNVFADIESILGGVYLEVSHGPNWIDGNFFWDIRVPGATEVPPPASRGAMGANIDTGEQAVVANNFFGCVKHGYAAAFHLNQRDRVVGGRVGLCRRNGLYNNIFADCPRRVFFAHREDNRADGNVYDDRNRELSLHVSLPSPATVDLPAWREYFGFDAVSNEEKMKAAFDPDTLKFCLRVHAAAVPDRAAAEGAPTYSAVGPFTLDQWQDIILTGLEVQLPLQT